MIKEKKTFKWSSYYFEIVDKLIQELSDSFCLFCADYTRRI